MKSQKGITLIALIITIIIMLILVAVSVIVALNGGLFEIAKKAANETKLEQEKEQKVEQITVGDIKYGTLEEYVENLERAWVTVYDKGETTTEGGLLISQNPVFDEFSVYRITVESNEFTGTVIAKPIYLEELGVYLLFLVENGNPITFTSTNSANDKLSIIDSGTLAFGVSDNSGSGILLTSATFDVPENEYTIKKIETALLSGNLIWEGEIIVPYENFDIPLKKANGYKVIGTVGGDWFSGDLMYRLFFDGFGMLSNKVSIILLDNKIIGSGNGDIVINKIYDMGDIGRYKEENGFELLKVDEKWALVKTPNTKYVVPTTVDGQIVDVVYVDWLKGIPVFNHVVDVEATGDGSVAQEVIVNVSDNGFVYDLICSSGVWISQIDMTGCGDNLEFSEEILNYMQDTNNVCPEIYVTEAVKSKYAENPFIKVKSE